MFDTWAKLADWRRKDAANNRGTTAAERPVRDRPLRRTPVDPSGAECFISQFFPPGVEQTRQGLRLSPRDWLGGDEGRDAGGGDAGTGCGRDTAGGGEGD